MTPRRSALGEEYDSSPGHNKINTLAQALAGYADIEMPIATIQALITVFKPHCTDCSTLTELAELAADRTRWRMGHQLFDRIRKKTLNAERSGDRVLEAQYLFEEACAKTLYNLSGQRAPFDTESPFYVIPNAFALARFLNISDSEVVRAIAP